jgi:hypothetical protein
MCQAQYRTANRESMAAYFRNYYAANRAQLADYKNRYYVLNREKIVETHQRYRVANREKISQQYRQYVSANREKIAEYKRQYRDTNRESLAKRHREYHRMRRRTDPWFRMAANLRNRQSRFFKQTNRSASMVRDLGCDREFFLHHIASQFTAGMTAENYGKVWHLDHIYPLSKAELIDRVQFLAVANWRNLRPMLGPENVQKSDAVTPEAQALFDQLKAEFSSYDGPHGKEAVPF